MRREPRIPIRKKDRDTARAPGFVLVYLCRPVAGGARLDTSQRSTTGAVGISLASYNLN